MMEQNGEGGNTHSSLRFHMDHILYGKGYKMRVHRAFAVIFGPASAMYMELCGRESDRHDKHQYIWKQRTRGHRMNIPIRVFEA